MQMNLWEKEREKNNAKNSSNRDRRNTLQAKVKDLMDSESSSALEIDFQGYNDRIDHRETVGLDDALVELSL